MSRREVSIWYIFKFLLIDSLVIQYIIDPGAMSFNLSLPMEVIIGSIPVRPNMTAPIAPKSYPDEFNNQQQQQQPSMPPIGFEDREFT